MTSAKHVAAACIGALSIVGTSCIGGERTLVEPPRPLTVDLTITVQADSEDDAAADRLGYSAGIPSAEVALMQPGFATAFRTATTDADGRVVFASVPSGAYDVSVRRLFDEAELAALGADNGAVAFVGQRSVEAGLTSTATVRIPVSYRHSLVISEWAFQGRLYEGNSYTAGGYLEVYNNGDTTIYLDGISIADALSAEFDLPGTAASCSAYAPWANDPAGIMTQKIASFPGSGREYPLLPGAEVVVATDAIDHRDIVPGFLDLRDADFEFIGTGDVDNPAVPNMAEHSLKFRSHGMDFPNSLSSATVLASAADPDTFARAKLPPNGSDYVRIPAPLVMDVFTTISKYFAAQQPPITTCPNLVAPAFDREVSYLMPGGGDWEHSFSRKVLKVLPDGRPVLQDTRSSKNDFESTARTPGVVGQ